MQLTKFLGGLLAPVALALFAGSAQASGGGAILPFESSTSNLASLQRGFTAFQGYCSGCHSLKYVRYNRVAQDLKIPDDLFTSKILPPGAKPGDVITSNMVAKSADWFGATPPDLSLTARARGADWVYSYLNTFYLDASRPLGVNNLQLPGASMPHVLGDLQGWQVKAEAHGEAAGHGEHHGSGLTLAKPGRLSPEEYQKFTADLTNFLTYTAEPARLKRIGVGWNVFIFLAIFGFLAYLLKKEYWKDVH